jgi:hypothetical protein
VSGGVLAVVPDFCLDPRQLAMAVSRPMQMAMEYLENIFMVSPEFEGIEAISGRPRAMLRPSGRCS